MMAYQHHTRQQKGSNIRKIVSTVLTAVEGEGRSRTPTTSKPKLEGNGKAQAQDLQSESEQTY